MTLSRISIEDSVIRSNGMMVQAFDGTKKSACGEVYLKVLVGPCISEVPFIAVDIPTIFNLLLARPWISLIGAISSTLHQKVKFRLGNKFISVIAKEISQQWPQLWCLSLTRSKLFQPPSITFEFVSINYIPEDKTFS